MADYTVPYAPSERYSDPYVGSLLDLMQRRAQAQAAAGERLASVAGQRWQAVGQVGADVARAVAEAPERQRQQRLQQMQFDDTVRAHEAQVAVDNIPTDLSQVTRYIGGLKPHQARAVLDALQKLQATAKQQRDQLADERGLSAGLAPSYSGFLDNERRAGRLSPAQMTQALVDRERRLTQPGAPDWAGADEADRLGVVASAPSVQKAMLTAQGAALADRLKGDTVAPGARVERPALPFFNVPGATLQGAPKTPTAEETALAAYRASLGLPADAPLTAAQLADYPRWKAAQGQSSAPASDMERLIARYAASKGKRPEDVTYDETLAILKQRDEATRDPRAPVLPVIIQGPNGPMAVTRPGNGAAPTATPVLGPNQQPLPRTPTGAERLSAANDAATLALLTDIEQSMSDEWIGPVAGRWAQATKNVPRMGPSTAQATFYANVATLRNQMINLLSGAAVSAAEESRMLDQLPDPTQNPSVFRANLAATKKNRERLLQMKTAGTGAAPPPGTEQ